MLKPEHKYIVGDIVDIQDHFGLRTTRPARIDKLAPYLNRPGYYITWQDIPHHSDPKTGILPSQGGWFPETSIVSIHIY